MNIPVIFRNLRGYDNHFIMQEIGQIVKKKNYTVEKQMKLNVIPNNMEKNMWLSCLVIIWFFLHSFQFVSSSLDKRVSNLPNEAFEIHITSREKEGRLSIWLYVQFW